MIHKMYALYEHIPEGIISSLENEYDLELNPFPNLKVITLDFKKEENRYILDDREDNFSDYDSDRNITDYFYRAASSNTVSPFLSLIVTGKGLCLKDTSTYSVDSKDYKKIIRILENNVEIKPELQGLLDFFRNSPELVYEKIHSYLDPDMDKQYLLTIRIDGEYIGRSYIFEPIRKKAIEDFYRDFYTLQDEKVVGDNLMCSMCLQKKEELWGYVSIYNFYAAKTEYAPIAGGFDKKKAYRNYPVCPECAAKLKRMKPVIDKYFDFQFCGFNYLLIPEIVTLGTNNEAINTIIEIMVAQYEGDSTSAINLKTRLGTFTLSERKKIVDADTKEVFACLAETDESASYTMLFYKAQHAEFKVLITIENVFPHHFKNIFDAKCKAEQHSIFKNLPGNQKNEVYNLEFRFDVLKEFLPKSTDGDFSNAFLEITRKIFVQQPVSYDFMLNVMTNIIRKKFVNDENYELCARKAFLILKFMSYLGIININNQKPNMEENMNPKFITFFDEHKDFFNSSAKQSIFMLGVLTQFLLNIQYVDKKGATPFRNRLNGLKLNKEIIQRIFTEVIEKLEEYDKNYYKEMEREIAGLLVQGGLEKLSNDEISFFFTLGMALNQEFKDQDEDKQEEQTGGNNE